MFCVRITFLLFLSIDYIMVGSEVVNSNWTSQGQIPKPKQMNNLATKDGTIPAIDYNYITLNDATIIKWKIRNWPRLNDNKTTLIILQDTTLQLIGGTRKV